jgi:hypothetical protein
MPQQARFAADSRHAAARPAAEEDILDLGNGVMGLVVQLE